MPRRCPVGSDQGPPGHVQHLGDLPPAPALVAQLLHGLKIHGTARAGRQSRRTKVVAARSSPPSNRIVHFAMMLECLRRHAQAGQQFQQRSFADDNNVLT